MTPQPSPAPSRLGPVLVTIGAVALFFLHQDVWFWSDATLVFGFMPIGLLYHACFSVAAGLLWLAAVKFAWPHRLEQWADLGDGDADADPATRAEPESRS